MTMPWPKLGTGLVMTLTEHAMTTVCAPSLSGFGAGMFGFPT